jgi:hypothetical protein
MGPPYNITVAPTAAKMKVRYALIENDEGSWEICRVVSDETIPECNILVPADGPNEKFLKRLYTICKISIKKSDVISRSMRGKFLARLRRQNESEWVYPQSQNKRRRINQPYC